MPDEFSIVQLGEIAEFEMSQAPSSQFVSDVGLGIPFLQGNAEFGSQFPASRLVCSQPAKKSKVDDILISVRAPVGATNKSDRIYAIGRGLAAIRFYRALPSFGWHLIRQYAPELSKVAQGSTFEAVGKQELTRLRVPLPPLPEQRRIAEVLDTLDTVIERTDALVQKLKLARAGLLHDLLTQGLDEQGQLRDPERNPEAFKNSELGRVPREWLVQAVSEICSLGRGRVISKGYLDTHPGVYPVYSSLTLRGSKNRFLSD